MSATNLVKAYTEYVKNKSLIKAELRAELHERLRPYAAALGEAIQNERDNGSRIEDISATIGLKNKTFVYDMLGAYVLFKNPDAEPKKWKPVPVAVTESIPADELNTEPAWQVTKHVNHVTGPYYDVEIWPILDEPAFSYAVFTDDDGNVIIPDAWANNPELKNTYRRIIKHIEEG